MTILGDEIVREKQAEGVLHYWPSYELVTDAFQMPFKHDRRHVKEEVLDYIMMLFERSWCVDSELDEADMLAGFIIAGASAGIFPAVLKRICEGKKIFRMEKVLEREELLSEPFADKALRGMLAGLVESWKAEGAAESAAGADATA